MLHDVKRYGRSLTGKLAIVMLLTAMVLTPTTYFALRLAMAPSFAKLEAAMVGRQNDRVRNGVEDFGQEVVRATRDYAVWDVSYEYLERPTRKFEQETLSPLAQQNLDVDFFGYVRFDGEVVRGEAIDLANATRLDRESDRLRRLVSSPAFIAKVRRENPSSTFMTTPRGIYAVASGWIRKSDGSGTPGGFVVMARRMVSSDLSSILRVPVTIETSSKNGADTQRLARPPFQYSTQKRGSFESVQALIGADGRPIGKVRFSTARNISRTGERTILLGSTAVLAVMLSILTVLSILVRRVAIRRLEQLAAHMHSAADALTFSRSPIGLGGDEIAHLAKSFDQTFEELRAAREQLRQQSYRQGKADNASGMLHNLRNALGPVRALQQKWAMEEYAKWRQHFELAVAELKLSPDDRRKLALEAFVVAASDRLVASSGDRRRELEESRLSLDQAIEILNDEQELADTKLHLEPVDLLELLGAASAIARHLASGEIAVSLPERAPSVLANKLQLAQLIGNLFKNAAEAILAVNGPDKRITVDLDEDDRGMVRIFDPR